MILPTPKRSSSNLEKLEYYDILISNGLDIETLKKVRERLYCIKTPSDMELFKKNLLLQCVNQIIEESEVEV